MTLDARLAALAGTIPLLVAATAVPFDQPVGGAQLGASGDPVVGTGPDAPELPAVDAASWLVADLDSGDVLAARNAHEPRRPASTIKLLTALALLLASGNDASRQSSASCQGAPPQRCRATSCPA